MATCTFCGTNVTGKKFCPECGNAVQPVAEAAAAVRHCPQCQSEVRADASFCMHCGASLKAAAASVAPPPPTTRPCPACHTQVGLESAFCTQCGHDMRAPVQPSVFQCRQCGHANATNMRFCGSCGAPLGNQSGQYTPPAANPTYQQQPYPQPYQQQPQPYGQSGYQMQPMMGQQPLALRCPTCMAMAPVGSTNCVSCRTSLAGVVPTPATMPMQGQQGGMGGFLQGNGGKFAMGALGGAAAIVGGEMLMHGIENQIEENIGFGGHHHHRRDDDDGMLGGLGRLADDIGLI